MSSITHEALMSAIRDCRQKAVIAEADLMAEDVSSAAEAIHAARDTLCGLLEMPFPPILRQAAIVGRSGLIASLHTLVATCDTFLQRSTRESLLPKIAPLTIDQWAAVNGAQAAQGVVALITFVLGSPLVQTVTRVRNEDTFN